MTSLPPFFLEGYYGYGKSIRKIICYRLQRSSRSKEVRQHGTEICKLGVCWAEVKKLYPAASYEVKKFNGLPYVYDPITGFMVYTSVTIEAFRTKCGCLYWMAQTKP